MADHSTANIKIKKILSGSFPLYIEALSSRIAADTHAKITNKTVYKKTKKKYENNNK